jgi:hypothetical protein
VFISCTLHSWSFLVPSVVELVNRHASVLQEAAMGFLQNWCISGMSYLLTKRLLYSKELQQLECIVIRCCSIIFFYIFICFSWSPSCKIRVPYIKQPVS